jgi:hypothetical protein
VGVGPCSSVDRCSGFINYKTRSKIIMKARLRNTIFRHTNSTNCTIRISITRNRRIYQRICRCLFLFLSGALTLKTIFIHFHNYIIKRYTYIKEYFEKPTILLFHQYPVAPLVLHLAQWRLANEAESLIVVQYATKPRNPE